MVKFYVKHFTRMHAQLSENLYNKISISSIFQTHAFQKYFTTFQYKKFPFHVSLQVEFHILVARSACALHSLIQIAALHTSADTLLNSLWQILHHTYLFIYLFIYIIRIFHMIMDEKFRVRAGQIFCYSYGI